MKVRAKLISENGKENRVVGYYGHRRIREGEVFELVTQKGLDRFGNKVVRTPEQQFSSRWMERWEETGGGKEPEPVSVQTGKKQTKEVI